MRLLLTVLLLELITERMYAQKYFSIKFIECLTLHISLWRKYHDVSIFSQNLVGQLFIDSRSD